MRDLPLRKHKKKNKTLSYSTVALTGLATVMKVVNPMVVNAEPSYSAAPFSGVYVSLGVIGQEQTLEARNESSPIPTATAGDTSAQIESSFVGFEESATTIIGRIASTLQQKDKTYAPIASLGFNAPLGQSDWLLGLEVSYADHGQYENTHTIKNDYTLSTVTGGTQAAQLSGTIANTAGTQTIDIEDGVRWSLAIKPAYAINSHVMVYGKAIYTGLSHRDVKVDYSTSTTFDSTHTYNDIRGYGLGLGTTLRLYSGFFVDISGEWSQDETISLIQNDAAITATLASHDLTSATHELITEIDTEAYRGAVKVGWRF